ncbi:MAG: hypothetical protein EOM50_02760 [Erysipelotrichia bacterium]|nr:hypothetical protein [Erysipelotrichia bacterium]NCC54006.1 hypothetical protein [Erysipelotrichia bacterium]
MDKNVLVIIILIVLAIVLTIAMQYVKVKKQNKMINDLQSGKFDSFDKLVNSVLVKMLFPRYNLEYLKLNSYILQGKEEEIELQFDFLLNARKNKAQKEDITMKAFNYYVGVENKEKCTELIEQIKTFTNERMVQEATIMYDVFVLKQGNHIDEILEMMEGMSDAQKGVNEYLLSVQYANIGDSENAKKYEKLSKKHLNEPLKK